MKKLALSVVALMALAAFSFAADASTFKGQIMDAMCAANGSHSPGGYAATHTNNPKDCTLACVKAGSKFVLYNAGKKTTLKLDDQEKARDFAGQKVSVVGTFDKATETIHVEKIEAES
jgi:environmental stress-induced protein Ves